MRALLSIRLIVPVMTALLALCATIAEYTLISDRVTEKKYESILNSIRFSAVQTQGNINRALRRDDLIAAKQSLLDLNYLSLTHGAYLVDENLIVQQTTNLNHIKASFNDLKIVGSADITRIRDNYIGEVIQNTTEHQATAIYPIDSPAKC